VSTGSRLPDPGSPISDPRSRFQLTGRVAVVTGARGKLGPVWVEALLEAGAQVAALDLPGARSAGFDDLARHAGTALTSVDCDITNRASIEAAASTVNERLGTASVLVNNAGVDQPPDSPGGRHQLQDLPIDEFRRMVEVNLLGTFQVIQVFGGRMAEPPEGVQPGGSIINIGSLYASVSPDPHFYDHLAGSAPFIKSPAYGASKAGVVSLTGFFATHWAGRGIRVNALSPGGVLAGQDPQFKEKYGARVPLGRMAEPEDLKGPLIFLASPASSYVTGHELRVEGGFTAW
jgi:NAD(P)-dependent dehydrogenase (short-subunit alcohol dehydrogenase family)